MSDEEYVPVNNGSDDEVDVPEERDAPLGGGERWSDPYPLVVTCS